HGPAPLSAASRYQPANLVLAASALGVATLIVVAIGRRRAWRPAPLGVVFCLVFLAIGVRAAVRVWTGNVATAEPVLVVVDWLAAAAAVAFLTLHGRYGVLIDNAEMVREYAEKDREARALAQVNEELRRLDELKSEFLAMVSHELRTPLTAIVGYSRLLLRQAHGTLTPKQLEHQEAIFRGAQRLKQILVTLVGNAVKFSTPGGEVRILAGRQREQLWVAVEDDGVGIAKDELGRIWDPFYQVEAPMRRRHGGSGLGLAIVRRLVE